MDNFCDLQQHLKQVTSIRDLSETLGVVITLHVTQLEDRMRMYYIVEHNNRPISRVHSLVELSNVLDMMDHYSRGVVEELREV